MDFRSIFPEGTKVDVLNENSLNNKSFIPKYVLVQKFLFEYVHTLTKSNITCSNARLTLLQL